MALRKTTILENGVELDYYRIATIHACKRDGNITIVVQSFLNVEARQEGKKEIGLHQYTMPFNESYLSLASLYTYLKTLTEFENAEDI